MTDKKQTFRLNEDHLSKLDVIANNIVRGGTSRTQAIRMLIDSGYKSIEIKFALAKEIKKACLACDAMREATQRYGDVWLCSECYTKIVELWGEPK